LAISSLGGRGRHSYCTGLPAAMTTSLGLQVVQTHTSYLQNAICPVASAESRRCLRSASRADLIVPATQHTTMGAGPRLRRRSTARLPGTVCPASQPISGCLQTFTENSLLYLLFLLTFFFITF